MDPLPPGPAVHGVDAVDVGGLVAGGAGGGGALHPVQWQAQSVGGRQDELQGLEVEAQGEDGGGVQPVPGVGEGVGSLSGACRELVGSLSGACRELVGIGRGMESMESMCSTFASPHYIQIHRSYCELCQLGRNRLAIARRLLPK